MAELLTLLAAFTFAQPSTQGLQRCLRAWSAFVAQATIGEGEGTVGESLLLFFFFIVGSASWRGGLWRRTCMYVGLRHVDEPGFRLYEVVSLWPRMCE